MRRISLSLASWLIYGEAAEKLSERRGAELRRALGINACRGHILFMGSVALSSLVAANAKSAAQMVLIMPPTQQVGIRTTNHNLLAAGGAQVTFSLLSLLSVCVINTLLASGVFTLRQQHARSSIHNYSYSMFGQLFLWHREKSATRFMICGCRCSYCLRKREIKRHYMYKISFWLLSGSFHCAGLPNH